MQQPAPPYYAVIFTSVKSASDEGYAQWDARMFQLVEKQEGYLGYESYSNADGKSVTISYWKNHESIAQWKNNREHQQAQQLGKEKWYAQYRIRVCKVERDYAFPAL